MYRSDATIAADCIGTAEWWDRWGLKSGVTGWRRRRTARDPRSVGLAFQVAEREKPFCESTSRTGACVGGAPDDRGVAACLAESQTLRACGCLECDTLPVPKPA